MSRIEQSIAVRCPLASEHIYLAIPLEFTGLGAAMLFIPLSNAILSAPTPSEGPTIAAF